MKHTALCALLALTLTACSDNATSIEAALQGTVYEVGGQNINLAGVEVTLVETGELVVTDANGEFDFEALKEGVYTLGFTTPIVNLEHEGDGVGDDDRKENEIEVEITRDGGDIEIRVSLDGDGKVRDFSHGDFEDRHALSELRMTEESDVRAEGYVKLSHTEHGQRFKVAVFGLEPGTGIDVFVGDDKLGSAETNADGKTCLVREDLDLQNLFGRPISVTLSDSGQKILTGEIPDLPVEKEREDDDGEGGDGEGDGGENEEPR